MEKQIRFGKGVFTLLVVFQMCSLQAQDQVKVGLEYWNEFKTLKEAVFKKEGDGKYCGSYHFARTHERLMKITLAIDDDIGNRKNTKRLVRFRKKLMPFVGKLEMESQGLLNEASSSDNKKDTLNRLTKLLLYADQLSSEITRKQTLANDPQCQQAKERITKVSAEIQKKFNNLKQH